MTTEELRTKLLGSVNLDGFKSIKVLLQFPYTKTKIEFQGIETLFEYINQQNEGWQKINGELPEDFKNSKKKFADFRLSIINYIERNFEKGPNEFQSTIRNFIGEFDFRYTKALFPFDSPETLFLLSINEKGQDYYRGAARFIKEDIDSYSFSNKDVLVGTLYAYEFSQKNNSKLVDRADIEDKSLEKLKSSFQEFINQTNLNVTNYLNSLTTQLANQSKEFDEIKQEKRIDFDEWFSTSKNHHSNFTVESKKSIDDIKKAYSELLKLQEPANYWSQRAAKLRKDGFKFRNILIGFLATGIILLFSLLWFTPEGLLESLFSGDKSIAIRWSIVFIVFISLIFLGVRYMSRVMFSSFHLARDAEEREHLTLFYLSLIKESKIDEKERHMILQSLFSRADTGLLKEDSSPTMPSGLDKILSNGKIIS